MKLVLGIFVIIMLVGIVNAQLIIENPPIDVTSKVNEKNTFQLTMTNNYTFELIDFEFTNLEGFTFPDITIPAGQTKTIDFEVEIGQSKFETIQSIISFKYLVDLPEGVETHNVNIKATNYDPNFLIIRQGDTVNWKNIDSISHSVTGDTFDQLLAPNATFSFTFNDIGTKVYQDTVLFFSGVLNILNSSTPEVVNNPSFDIPLLFNIQISLDPTTLFLVNNKNNYTVEATGSKEGVLTLTNTGNITAQNIELSANPNWIRFDENRFELEPGGENFINYHVEPSIFTTEETNKEYLIVLTIRAPNTPTYTEEISVFIPFNDNFDDVETDEGILAFLDRFCGKNPNNLICNNTIQRTPDFDLNFSGSIVQYNFTEETIASVLQRLQRGEDSQQRLSNNINQLIDRINLENPQILGLVNQSLTNQERNRSSSIAKIVTYSFLIFFVVVCLIGYFVSVHMKNYIESKRRYTGGIGTIRY